MELPLLTAWASGPNGITAWCPDCKRFHYAEPEFDRIAADGELPVVLAKDCRFARYGVVALQLQPGVAPHRDGRGRWWWPDETGRLVRKPDGPPRLDPIPAPDDLAQDLDEEAPFDPVSSVPCPYYCVGPCLTCERCEEVSCPCEAEQCPNCASDRPHTCRLAHYPLPCPACRVERQWAIAAWEDEPTDPDDDLEVLKGYDTSAIRAEQEQIRQHPVYQVITLIEDDELRENFLAHTSAGHGFDATAADDFFRDSVCECPSIDDGGRKTIYHWGHQLGDRCPHNEPQCNRCAMEAAARCSRCLVKEAIEEGRFQELMAATGLIPGGAAA